MPKIQADQPTNYKKEVLNGETKIGNENRTVY